MSKKTRRKYVWKLFGVPLATSIVVCFCMILIGHLRWGNASPGIGAITKSSLKYWIPLLLVIFFLVPSVRSLLLVRRLRHEALKQGLEWHEYLDERRRARTEQ